MRDHGLPNGFLRDDDEPLPQLSRTLLSKMLKAELPPTIV